MSTFLTTLQEAKGEPIRKKKVARETAAPKSAKTSSTVTGAASQRPRTAATRALKREPARGNTTLPSSTHGPSRPPGPVRDTRPGAIRQAVSQTVTPVVGRTPIPKRRTGTGLSSTLSSCSKPASPSADGDHDASSLTAADRPYGHEVSLDDASQSTGHVVIRDFAPATHPPPSVREKYKLGDEELSRRLKNLKSRKRNNSHEENNRGPLWGLEVSVPSPVYEYPSMDQGPSIASPAGTDSSYHPKSPDLSCIPQAVDPPRHITYELPIKPELVTRAAAKDEAHPQRSASHDHWAPASPQTKRGPRRLRQSQYASMKQHELLNEVQVRELELYHEGKEHLIEILTLNDISYCELMYMLDDRYEATEFARRCVKHEVYKQRAKEARAKAARMVFQRTPVDDRASEVKKGQEYVEEPKEEFKAELNEMKNQSRREKLGPEPVVREQKRESDRIWKRKDSNSSEASDLIKLVAPPLSGDDTGMEQPKGKKRARQEDEEAKNPIEKKSKTTSLGEEDAGRSRKKAKASSPSRTLPGGKPQRKPVALPRAMQASANKEPSTKSTDVEMSDADDSVDAQPRRAAIKQGARRKKPPQAIQRRTRSTSTIEEPEDEEIEDADQLSEEGFDDYNFIVEDIDYRPKRSKVGAMARTKLFAGIR
ncbi:hypothetical protein DDE82_004879 [Stemphylium lycopersici]|uniref:Uncharacterized protein n=1 Tax=Stemphylium lycopersici TaxID=183478 RepID=A0A364NFV9_STELY|nr:hypothetical protein TW65_03701 [Stemphylium lycopersici]RAR03792.1 hypothetical protein DDE82_004879 [Stemphylium lycopersici]RAR16214.1 hypothetical protein DDE83_000340 [Stemphylium lycopersici]